MNENLDWYAEGERFILYNRADGGGGVRIWRQEIAEVILWLSAFQQGVQLTDGGRAESDSESTPATIGN